MPAEESRKSIPFEPPSNKPRKPAGKKKSAPVTKPQPPAPAKAVKAKKGSSGQIPEIVSNRMIRRALFFCGTPMLLGMSVFLLGYFAIINHWFPVSNTVVLLSSMACLGLSVLGLSYGILSACWEEDSSIKGSLLGWAEFKTNFGRMAAAYRENKRMRANLDRQ
jgi:Photosynthesis affected mutant 68